LDASRAKGLCPEHVSSFYDNLATILQQGTSLVTFGTAMNPGCKLGGMEEPRYWRRKGSGACIRLFQKRGSGFRSWCASTRRGTTFRASIFFAVRASRETTLKSVKIMHPWPYSQRLG
jgi:hypothetical protein